MEKILLIKEKNREETKRQESIVRIDNKTLFSIPTKHSIYVDTNNIVI